MIVGCYTLDLYCEHAHSEAMPLYENGEFIGYYESPMIYTGETRAECIRKARKAGWRIHKDRQLCPVCTGKLRAITTASGL